MDKRTALRDLGSQRQHARWHGYACVGDYHEGGYEHDEVSPYSKTASNVDAAVFLLLQDWASDDWLRGPFDPETAGLGHTPGARTNKCLVKLLAELFGYTLADVYGTNLFPFVKPGGVSSSIRFSDLVRAAREYALPQVDIVQPQLVVCLGLATFGAVAVAIGHAVPTSLDEAMMSPIAYGDTQIWCQAHPAARGRAFAGHLAAWKRMQREIGAHRNLIVVAQPPRSLLKNPSI